MRKSLPILILTLAVLSLSTTAMADAAPANAPAGVVNINTADVAQLELLPRVGAKAAERIVAYRKEHGAFKRTSDLMQVKGIGAKTFELLTPYLTVEGKTTLTTKVSSPRKRRAPKAAS
jgi:competence protein ComEA